MSETLKSSREKIVANSLTETYWKEPRQSKPTSPKCGNTFARVKLLLQMLTESGVKSQIHRQIEAARTVDVILLPFGNKNGNSLTSDSKANKIPLSTTPLTEGAIRPIASSGLTDDQKREVWQQVFEGGKPITEKSVKKAGFFGSGDHF